MKEETMMPRRSLPYRAHTPPPPPSAEELRAKAVEHARCYLAAPDFGWFHPNCLWGAYRSRTQAKEHLVKWQEMFAKDPAHELAWSVGTFETAGELKVLEEMIHHHERGVSNRDILAELERELERSARRGLSRSTSPTSNLMEDAIRLAHGKYAEVLRSSLIHHDEAVAVLYEEEGY